MKVRVFRALSTHGNPQVTDPGYAYKLNGMYLDAPLPPTLAADVREIFSRLAVPYGAPFSVSKLRSDYSGASICDGIVEVIYFQKCLANIGDTPGDHNIKADAVTVGGGRRKTGEPRRSRHYVILEHNIKIEGEAPVEARLLQIANRFAKS